MSRTKSTSSRCLVAAVAGLLTLTVVPLSGQTEKDIVNRDFEYLGRKSTLTLGSAFNTLALYSPLDNPAGLAYASDNHIAFDVATTGNGVGHHITLAAPNFSISSGNQTHETYGEEYRTKSFFRIAYGFGFGSGNPSDGFSFAIGTALNRKVDSIAESELFDDTGVRAEALTAEAGAIVNLGAHRISARLHDIVLSGDADKVYVPRIVVGYSTVTSFGTRVAVNGMPGAGYGSSTALGFRLGVGQSFFNSRLDTRLQLSSFFTSKGEATMQNITGGIGYRLAPKRSTGLAAAILDTEFSYTLSFLAWPVINGAHLIGMVKYF